MYQTNDTILYGSRVCRITEIAQRNLTGTPRDYYILRPVYQDSETIYVPTTSAPLTARMRRILSAEEIHALIREMPATNADWIENDAERREAYQTILGSGDRRALVRMIRALHVHQAERQAQGRRLHISDERFLKEAERVLYDEFALVLRIRPEQVLPFILEQIEVAEKEEAIQ